MNKYGKLEQGCIRYAPNTIKWQGHIVNNPDEAKLKELGYLLIKNVDMPQDAPQGQHYESSWEQTETEIAQVWKLVEDEPLPPMPPTIEERILTIEGKTESLTQANSELTATVDSILTDVLPSLMGM